jgi:hypothetical protein
MGDFDRLTAAQLRAAAEALGEWVAAQRHDAQAAAEVLDRDGATACSDRADRADAVRAVLAAEAVRREAAADREPAAAG